MHTALQFPPTKRGTISILLGSIYGTARAYIRLGKNEMVFYNGHKCLNGIKFYGSFMNHLWKFNFNIFCS